MKADIILSGVGGQGMITVAAIIAQAALDEGLNVKQAEIHGMSQRGGDVQSFLRLSSEAIYSDQITKGCANAIISLEPMEALRHIRYLAKDGWVISSSIPFVNISNYPELADIIKELNSLPNVILLDVEELAKESGSIRTANIVLLGAASEVLGIDAKSLKEAVKKMFSHLGEKIIEANMKAFELGQEAGRNAIK